MSEVRTWRTVLGTLLEDPQQRHKIAAELGVHPVTLTRWAEKKSDPRLESLRRLLAILPQRRELLPLIAQEFPEIFQDAQGDGAAPEALPSAFYHEILGMLISLPPSQAMWTISQRILRFALDVLDLDHGTVSVWLTQCVTPKIGAKVHSLRSFMALGDTPWGGKAEQQSILLGIESVPGRTVSLGRPVIIQDHRDTREIAPERSVGILSSCSYPLVRLQRVMGAFGAISAVPEYFLPARQKLIEQCATLLSVVFPLSMFYMLEDLDMRIMPHPTHQLPYLDTFQARLQQVVKEAAAIGQHMTGLQAEQLVWQQLEEELIRVASTE